MFFSLSLHRAADAAKAKKEESFGSDEEHSEEEHSEEHSEETTEEKVEHIEHEEEEETTTHHEASEDKKAEVAHIEVEITSEVEKT